MFNKKTTQIVETGNLIKHIKPLLKQCLTN